MSKKIHNQLLAVTSNKYSRANQMFRSNGILYLKKRNGLDFFDSMARTVAGQQLSKQAADTIWGRILTLAKSFETDLYDFCSDANFEQLKSCGLSKYKVKAIIQLKQSVANKEIDVAYLTSASHTEIRAHITKLWGFGNWSADMIALFFFGNQDVWSPDDAALKRGMKFLVNGDEAEAASILNEIRPYRSFLCLHIWKALDNKILS